MAEPAHGFQIIPPPRRIRFGPFEADSRSGELRKHGIKVRLGQQTFQILMMLLERPGDVVLREEIRVKLWPHDTVVEFDHSINAAIQKLRDALGESASDPRYIETLPRRGYRFIGTVEAPQPVDEPATAPEPLVEPTTETRDRRLPSGIIVTAAVLALAALVAIGAWLRTNGQKKPAMTLTVVPPAGTTLTDIGQVEGEPEISPDGSAVLYHAGNREYIRRLDSPDPRPVPGFEGTTSSQFWSPDSRTVYFNAREHLTKVRLPDGLPEAIAPMPSYTRGGSVGADGTILIYSLGLRVIPPSGSEPKLLEMPDSLKAGRALYAEFLPESNDFLFIFAPDADPEGRSIYLATLHAGKAANPVLLLKNQTTARYTPAGAGRILFIRDDDLYSQRINLRARKLEGQAELVVRGVASQPELNMHRGYFSVAYDGTLAWRRGRAAQSQVVILDRQGKRIGTAGPLTSLADILPSADEKRLLLTSGGACLVEAGQPGRLELPKDVYWFGWFAGGSKLLGIRGDAFVEMPAGGLGEVRELRKTGKLGGYRALDIAADGKQIIGTSARGMFSVQLDGTPDATEPRAVPETGVLNFGVHFSPDAHWFVYENRDSGGGLYVRPFPGPGPRHQIAPAGGKAAWRKDGKEIVYLSGQNVMSVAVEQKGGDLRFGEPRVLFSVVRLPAGMVAGSEPLAISRDGSRIFWLEGIEQPDSNMIYIKTGWVK